MSIHRNITGNMKKVEKCWDKIHGARCDMEGSATRRIIFARAKEKTDDLYAETKKIMPSYIEMDSSLEAREIKEAERVFILGGLSRILNGARNATDKIDAVEQALEEDVSRINFSELEERDRKFRPAEILFKVGKALSLLVTLVGGTASLILGKYQQSEEFYQKGIWVAASSLGCYIVLGIAHEKFGEYLKPGVKRINEIIANMREGLAELRESLKELVENTSIFSR